MHTVISGSVAGKTHLSPVNPIGKTAKKPLDHITLHLLKESVSLSQIRNEIEALISFLEQVLSGQFANHPISPSVPYFSCHLLCCLVLTSKYNKKGAW